MLSREVRLKSRPVGLPTPDNFDIATVELPEPASGEVQVRNTWMTVDPYMRGRMNDVRSYAPPFALGEAMQGGAVGQVVASNVPGLREGDLVQSMLGWREAFNAPGSAVQKLDTRGLPPQAFLGVAGMPGLTAYVGLLRVAALKPGDVVFVSGAAGAVGSVACQIAKARGHTVVASAGGPEKVAFLREIGVDHPIDYKTTPKLVRAIFEAAPEGIDVGFENVGGEHLEAAVTASRRFARIAVCGLISQYNGSEPPTGPRNFAAIIGKNIRLEGFVVGYHQDLQPQFLSDIAAWIAGGQIAWRETVVEGLERAPEAFLGLFSGQNLGKMLVRLAE